MTDKTSTSDSGMGATPKRRVCHLNVSYEGEYSDPDDFLSKVIASGHSETGFDVKLQVHCSRHDVDRVIQHLIEMAEEFGDPNCLVSACAERRSKKTRLTVRKHERGSVTETWNGSQPYPSDFAEVFDEVESEIGRRPASFSLIR